MARRHKSDGRKKSLKRPVNIRNLRQRFLIVCEGEKTEPLYFKKFRVPKKIVTQAYLVPALRRRYVLLRRSASILVA